MEQLGGIVNTIAGGNIVGRDGIQVSASVDDGTIVKLSLAVILTVIIARIGYIAVSRAFGA